MVERKAGAVERVTWEQEVCAGRRRIRGVPDLRRELPGYAVYLVTDDGVAQELEVHPHLIGPSGDRSGLHQTHAVEPFEYTDERP
jgi:hypothetical protein